MINSSSLDKVVSLPNSERKNIFLKTAYELSISEPLIVEKDLWVSWILEKLFSPMANFPTLIFKGGTSLSKAYNCIQRFSEDIDITIVRHDLGFIETDSQILEKGNKRRKRYFENLQLATYEIINKTILPYLQDRIHSILREQSQIKLDEDSHEKIIFEYPSCFSDSLNQYLLPRILIEFGSRGDIQPVEKIALGSYVQKALPQLDTMLPEAIVLKPERTFIEKMLILHKFAHTPLGKVLPIRQSRHYYDVVMLANNATFADLKKEPGLLRKAAIHNMAFFKSANAFYETADYGTIKLLPTSNILNDLIHDYNLMQSMFIGEPPQFATLLEKLEETENYLNSWLC